METKMEEQEKNPASSELGGKKLMKMYINSLPTQFYTCLIFSFLTEPSLVCEEDEIMRSKESPDLSISHSQV